MTRTRELKALFLDEFLIPAYGSTETDYLLLFIMYFHQASWYPGHTTCGNAFYIQLITHKKIASDIMVEAGKKDNNISCI